MQKTCKELFALFKKVQFLRASLLIADEIVHTFDCRCQVVISVLLQDTIWLCACKINKINRKNQHYVQQHENTEIQACEFDVNL